MVLAGLCLICSGIFAMVMSASIDDVFLGLMGTVLMAFGVFAATGLI